MFLRALRICSPEYIHSEFNRIYDIAMNLKYPKHVVDTALTKAKRTHYCVNERQFSNKNLLVLPYHDNFTTISNVLRLFNINVIFKNNFTVKNELIRNSPQCNEGCIYTIPCKNCNMFYIGQTSKSLEQRKKQHRYSVRTGQGSNALFIHVRDSNHTIDWENCKVLRTSKSFAERNIIESCIIKHTSKENLNLSDGLYKLDKYIVEKISTNVLSSFQVGSHLGPFPL